MGLGIKEPTNYDGDVTGTIMMMSMDDSHPASPDILSKVTSHDSAASTVKTNKQGIVLFPQPHNNPNDPLNWPIWQRDLALVVIGFHSFIVGGQSPLLAAGLTTIGAEFHASPSKVSYLVGGFMLSLGFGSVFAAPSAVLYGKRVVYLAGILIFMGGSIWGACANSFGSLMGARVLTGLGASPCESLPSATIAEIYFAHERAYRLGIYTMLLLGGKNLVPMLAGFVFQSLNRHWLYWILTIILGINLVLTYFFAPETFWDRTPIPNKESQKETEKARKVSKRRGMNLLYRHRPNSFALKDGEDVTSLHSSVADQTAIEPVLQPIAMTDSRPIEAVTGPAESTTKTLPTDTERASGTPPRNSFYQKLRIVSGRHTEDKWWMVAVRPFVLLLYPSVLFGAFLYAFAVVWLILISESVSHLFTKPPYNYSVITIGLFYVSPFVGGTLGSAVAGKISDILVRKLVARNNGTYEPEFRLLMVVPIFIAVCIGIMGFGWATEVHDKWIVPVIFFGILGFGCSLASTTAITYTVDSYKMFAAEALVTLNVTKNVLGFLFSLFTNSFIDRKGAKDAFVTFGGIQIFICLFAIPLYFYGKRCRHWTDEREFMKWLYVKRHHEAK
ncbi:hypothetical protein BABINDRAFT_160126 [Babjeviella inositovora NRRL Y-12698]|uniref:Major facilitator superfamily (MFS) profile domain-containing protein n=1 Tax=Babjeviella inositovora NRRL Y-12698 TaxID=984486 RepID=A0A1E3QWJ8_9ASCO|nr:uncharacterized protein BABINDRAFT_160126 [Babjeviella inositovora NRRL Y-12698]ODQ81894.1 hypothetical protein BABINDRAFT_160126 [Babjeviella inositovora NRRL Y-12698]